MRDVTYQIFRTIQAACMFQIRLRDVSRTQPQSEHEMNTKQNQCVCVADVGITAKRGLLLDVKQNAVHEKIKDTIVKSSNHTKKKP